jgi:hypothetical protein
MIRDFEKDFTLSLIQILEPVLLSSLMGVEEAINPNLTKEEITKLLDLTLQIEEEMNGYKDMFSADIHGKILEIKHSLLQFTNVGDK